MLKEWSAVCQALKDGRQILLARKGGILDAEGGFAPSFPEFFLYPTRWHQTEQIRAALKPSEYPRYGIVSGETGDCIRLSVYCQVAETQGVTDASVLRRLNSEHIWNPDFLENRFDWGKQKGLTVLAVRVFEVDPPQSVSPKPSYAGCKSWIEDREAELPAYRLKPVLSEKEFLQKLSRFRDLVLGK